MKKYLLLFLAVVVLGAGSYFSERSFLSSAEGDTLQSKGVTLAALDATKRAGIDFTLTVGEKQYEESVPRDSTILDAMNVLASSTDFRFTSKEFPGMGAFVESINGKIAADGYYWILYVNGVKPQQGISSIIVGPEDRIKWKYEKGY